MNRQRPAADRFRPRSFDEMVGQKKLVGPDGVLRKLSQRGILPSVIFYGPPGTGKTTAAMILAEQSDKQIFFLNATVATLADVKEVAAATGSVTGCSGVVLYLDEIQYFNKKQQQSLLSYIEDGSITLVASTTENPYYYVYDALLSRCSVFEFRPVSDLDIEERLRQIAPVISDKKTLTDAAFRAIAVSGAGDVRRAVNALELVLGVTEKETVDKDDVADVLPEASLSSFDRDGDVHYDLLSCLQKSIRGSDPDAAVFYLARLLEGGDIISPIRRLQVIASEDIGQAYPLAAAVTRACCESAKELGLPEAAIPLANATVMLATAPKSNTANAAYEAAQKDVRQGMGREIPSHLRSPLFKGYKYPHDYPGRYVKQQYLPDDLTDRKYYVFGENRTEQAAKAYLDRIKGEDQGK